MVRINNLLNEKIIESNLPLVIGYFNCIHLMHHKLLSRFSRFNILTFSDFSAKNKNMIYSYQERINALKEYKPKIIYVYKIQNNNIKGLDFINNFLKKINPSKIVVGSNFKFGIDHKNVTFLEKYFYMVKIKQNKYISTTYIINLLRNGQIQQANKLLKQHYSYTSSVIKGRKIGSKIGCPTINLKINKLLILPDGVYATKIYFKKHYFKSVTFIGKSKTTSSLHRTLEIHVIDCLFKFVVRKNTMIKVEFISFLRKNKKFSNILLLKKSINNDICNALKYFKT